jgi:hypothetical protein
MTRRSKTTQTPTEPGRVACLCGCGAFPSKPRSRYLPGHDAKHHAALERAAAENADAKPKAKRGKPVAA